MRWRSLGGGLGCGDEGFHCGAWNEFDGALGRDVAGLAGSGVAAFSGRFIDASEGTEALEDDIVSSFEGALDGLDERNNREVGGGRPESGVFEDVVDEFGSVHGDGSPRVGCSAVLLVFPVGCQAFWRRFAMPARASA